MGDHAGALAIAKAAAKKLEEADDQGRQALALARAATSALTFTDTSAEGFALSDEAMSLLDSTGQTTDQIPLKLAMARAKLVSEAFIEAEDLAEEAQLTSKEV